MSPFDGGIRTPIRVSWPGHVRPASVDLTASVVDIMPTLLKLTGARVPADGDGLNLLDDEALRGRPLVAGQNPTHDLVEIGQPASSLRYCWPVAGDPKFTVSSGFNGATEPPRLFDLTADPAGRS